MKKTIALLLALCLALPAFAACGKGEEVPDNMQEAAIATAPYHLYVPQTWLTTTSSGISGAKVNTEADAPNVTVTAYYPDSAMTPAAYFEDVCLPDYAATLHDFTRITARDGDTTLGGKDAKRYVFSHSLNGKVYQVMQIITAGGDMIYVLTYTATAAQYNDHVEEVESIRAAFVFR